MNQQELIQKYREDIVLPMLKKYDLSALAKWVNQDFTASNLLESAQRMLFNNLVTIDEYYVIERFICFYK